MLSGKKSDLKRHLSAKHPTFAHKVMARGAKDQVADSTLQEKSPRERGLPPKSEGPKVLRFPS
jgi:hypothetical protein